MFFGGLLEVDAVVCGDIEKALESGVLVCVAEFLDNMKEAAVFGEEFDFVFGKFDELGE